MSTNSQTTLPQKLTRLGLGTAHFGLDYGLCRKKTQCQVDAIIEACINAGICVMDTARGYGDSEMKIGDYFRRHPGTNVVIATKLAVFSSEDPYPIQKKKLRESIERSLEALRLNTLPVLKLHQDTAAVARHPEFWHWISEWREERLFEYFGVSFYEPEKAQDLLDRCPQPLDIVQFPYNVFDQRYQGLLPRFGSLGIATVSRSVYLKGILTLSAPELPKEASGGLREACKRLSDLAAMQRTAVSHMALRFVLMQPLIDCSVIGFDSPDQIRETISVMNQGPLDGDVYEEILKCQTVDPALIDPRTWSFL